MKQIRITKQTKRCSKCGLIKNTSEFGTSGYCKPCYAKYRRELRRNNKKYNQNSNEPKTCPKCRKTKPLREFYDSGYCKKCGNELAKLNRNPNSTPREILPPGKKRCSKCKNIFDLVDMNRSICKSCSNKDQRERYRESKKVDMTKTKVCRDCDVEKPLSEYAHPRHSYCRNCYNARQRQRHKHKQVKN